MINRSGSIKVIVFDMGNVILPFDHMLICNGLSKIANRSSSEIFEFIFTGGLEKKYDEGKVSSERFYEKLKDFLKSDLGFNEFCDIWSDIFQENTEISKLIKTLKMNQYHIYLLSNTNELHYEFAKEKFKIINEFHEHILSYKIGYGKPQLEIFQEALDRSGLPANEHVFIDDIEENVNAAQSIGMAGIPFISARQLKSRLKENGIEVSYPE
jgi:putative hydrolase of the HAD superfamily